MFQIRCRQQKIIIQKLPDDTVIAYRADDRDDKSELDTAVEPFNKIIKLISFS